VRSRGVFKMGLLISCVWGETPGFPARWPVSLALLLLPGEYEIDRAGVVPSLMSRSHEVSTTPRGSGSPDFRFLISDCQLALSPATIENRQLTIGNRETRYREGGTDLMGPRHDRR
jgi:hypothetical protein